jgi:hypothetical protein
LRAAVAIFVVLVATAVVTEAVSPLWSASGGRARATATVQVNGGPHGTLTGGSWRHPALPTDAGVVDWLSPDPDDPLAAALCAVRGTTITIWRTTDFGQQWHGIPLATPGVSCSGARGPDAPNVLAVLVDAGSGCQGTLYTSRDGGALWGRVLTLPALSGEPKQLNCEPLISAQHLFLIVSDSAGRQSTRLLRSDDGGASWVDASADLGQSSLFRPLLFGDGQTLVASVAPSEASSRPNLVWITHDAGTTWSEVGTVNAGIMLLAAPLPGSSGPSASDPLYDLTGEQLPADLLFLRVSTSVDGGIWSAVPPLPVSGATVQQGGLLYALAVAPTGMLLAFGVQPSLTISSGQVLQNNLPTALWAWSPRTGRWSVLPGVAPAVVNGCVLCWHGAVSSTTTSTYLWAWGSSDPQRLEVFRIALEGM